MQSDELAILLFWLTLAVGMAVEAVKAETLTRRVGFGGTATLFLLIGVFWQQLQSRWPKFTASVDSIVQSPETWFILCVLGYLMVSYWSPKRRPDSAGTRLQTEFKATIEAFETKFRSLRESVKPSDHAADIARLNELGVAQHAINEALREQNKGLQDSIHDGLEKIDGRLKKIESQREYDFKQVDTRFRMTCTAIRARDMMALLEKNDIKIRELGDKLLAARAEDYPNRTKWLGDFGIWRETVQWTDAELNHWGEDWAKYNKPFLHLTSRDFEKVPQLPPDTIKPSDGVDTVTPYKILCSVMPRWAASFPNIMLLMKQRANELGG
jgi:hypothetical protein